MYIVIGILILIGIFLSIENFTNPLKAYLGMINKDKNYESGVPDRTQDNNACDRWTVTYSGGVTGSVCVPKEYSETGSYIPCSSENPGIDNDNCQNAYNDNTTYTGCTGAMKNVVGIVPKGDEQQYIYKCRNNICPCMNKYGTSYKGLGSSYNCNCDFCSDFYTCKLNGIGCPTNCEETMYGCCDGTFRNADGSNCKDKCKNTEFGCCLNGKPRTDNTGNSCRSDGCDKTPYGCCPDFITAKKDDRGTNCPTNCQDTKYGCCYDISFKNINGSNCDITKDHDNAIACMSSPYGCCSDGTIRKSPDSTLCGTSIGPAPSGPSIRPSPNRPSIGPASGLVGYRGESQQRQRNQSKSNVTGYSDNVMWSECVKLPTKSKNEFFNETCKKILPSSKFVTVHSENCPLNYAKVGCSYDSPNKL